MSVSIEQCQKQEKSRLAACRQSWIFLVFDRAKAREQEGAKQLPACTAELERDRAKAREQEQRKVEKKKRKQVITCELEWDMMFIN